MGCLYGCIPEGSLAPYPTARATGPLLSAFFAVLFLGEQITPQIAIGGAVIIFGVLMLRR